MCDKQLAWHYTKLVTITDAMPEKTKYVNIILRLFLGNNESSGILSNTKNIPDKKIASVYNGLGNILLQLREEKIELNSFYIDVVKRLKLEMGDDLNIIEQLFNLAKSHSRYTDHTKADSYEGLIKVNYQRMQKDDISEEIKNQLLIKTLEYKKETKRINQTLNRNYTQDLLLTL